MKSLFPGIIPELDKEIVLSAKERKALLYYINLGRFFITLSAICSFVLIPLLVASRDSLGEPIMLVLLIFWFGLAAISILKSAPIVFFIMKNFIEFFSRKDLKRKDEHWEHGYFLLSAFLGWDLIFQKKVGAKEKYIENPADFWSDAVSDKMAFTEYAQKKLDYFNNRDMVEAKYKLACYQCFFEAAHELGVVDEQYYYKDYPSPIAIARFLDCLGPQFTYSKQNFGKGKIKATTIINTSEKYGLAKDIIQYLKKEMSIYLKSR